MTRFLNLNFRDDEFKEITNNEYFVDKTELILKINKILGEKDKYICITRPRRFGKTTNAKMLASYYSKGSDFKNLFDKLSISKDPFYLEHLNRHNVFFISFDILPKDNCTYAEFIERYKNFIIGDLKTLYPNLTFDSNWNLSDAFNQVYTQTGERFIFIIDEWDYIFNGNFFTVNEREQFLQFLKDLLKGQPYVELAYMTGVLPIAKYSSGSALNMFREYDCLNDSKFDRYFGFTEEEVEMLCKKQNKISLQELKEWYDGYHSYNGLEIYNPRSVNSALNEGVCMNYWTNTGPVNEILLLIKTDLEKIRDNIIEMISGKSISVYLEEYGAENLSLDSKEEIFSAMVIYGLLDYNNGNLRIPNKELLIKFGNALRDKSMGEVSKVVKRSMEMLQATIDRDTKKMEEIVQEAHDLNIPMIKYNDENSLSCIITLVYLFAKDRYKIVREYPTGKGFADFVFFPIKKSDPAFILELKKNSTPEEAIQQIKEKNYTQCLKDYTGEKLLVGISYDSRDKKHHVKIEEIK